MITKDTVQYYSKYDIFNQLEIEREKVKELRELLKISLYIEEGDKITKKFQQRVEQALNKEK